MRKLFFLILLALIVFSLESRASENNTINSSALSDTLIIATYNIRIETFFDKGTRSWKNRRKSVGQLIIDHKIDVVGIQEIRTKKQEKELSSLLPHYSYISKGRNNSKGTSGERLAIFYNKTRFEEKDNGFFFLSETPDRLSKGWDALYTRICVWVKLHDKNTNRSFYVFNKHSDHVGQIAKEKSSQLVTSKIKEIAGNASVICCGDFNSSPIDTLVHNAMKSELADSKLISHKNLNNSEGTFNGWDAETNAFPEHLRIDYIYCKNVDVFTYDVLTTKSESGFYPSDHLPVIITCRIKEEEK